MRCHRRLCGCIEYGTGIGDAPVEYMGVLEDGFPPSGVFRAQLSATEKLAVVFASDSYPWGSNEVFRYRSMDSFILAAEMDGFLKSGEGTNANTWDMVLEETRRMNRPSAWLLPRQGLR